MKMIDKGVTDKNKVIASEEMINGQEKIKQWESRNYFVSNCKSKLCPTSEVEVQSYLINLGTVSTFLIPIASPSSINFNTRFRKYVNNRGKNIKIIELETNIVISIFRDLLDGT